jgi:KaiC/GvpD/RAD55 family RecA-like ATPase
MDQGKLPQVTESAPSAAAVVEATDLLIPLLRSPVFLEDFRDHIDPSIWVPKLHQAIVTSVLSIWDSNRVLLDREALERAVLRQGWKNAEDLQCLLQRIFNADSKLINYHREELIQAVKRNGYEAASARYAALVREGKFEEATRCAVQASSVGVRSRTVSYTDAARVARRVDPNVAVYDRVNIVPTGYRFIDDTYYGGTAAGEVFMFIADTGVGKSRMLQNDACFGVMAGFHVLYCTLELRKEIIEGRADQYYTGMSPLQLKTNDGRETLEAQIAQIKAAGGELHVAEWEEYRCTTAAIVAEITRIEQRTGKKIAKVVIDFVDKMVQPKQFGDNQWQNQEYLFNEVRGRIARECNVAVETASQENKAGQYQGAQGKAGMMDGIWHLRVRPTDKMAHRLIAEPTKIRLNDAVRADGYMIKLVEMEDGIRIQQVDEWPVENMTEEERAALLTRSSS